MGKSEIAACACIITVFLQTTGSMGQSITFNPHNETEVRDECIARAADNNDGMTVLTGKFTLPQNANLANIIVFDLKSKMSANEQFCLIDTTNKCKGSSVKDDCYCAATDTTDLYSFVVNISTTSTKNRDLIIGYLLYKNGSKVQAEYTLPKAEAGLIDTELTYMSINGKLAETICNQTIHDKELFIEAGCRIPRKTCWLELWVNDNSSTIINSGNITSLRKLLEQSEINITLRRSVCDQEKFETVHHCVLRVLPESSEDETGSSYFIVIYISAAVIGTVVIVIVILCIVFRRKHKKKESTNVARKTDEKSVEEGRFLLTSGTSFETKNNDRNPLQQFPVDANEQEGTAVEEIPPKKPPRLHSITSSEFEGNPPTNTDSITLQEMNSQENDEKENKI
ncbi:hypothetical protein Btru_071837 [Bulinus truncatus]|nr:hypothetical protein Btru_071837 [Bulinus truncatus]